MKKKIGLTAVGLMLVLSLIGAADGGVAAAAEAVTTTPTTAPTLTEAPTTTEAPAPTTTEAPPTTEAPAPTTTEAPASTAAEPAPAPSSAESTATTSDRESVRRWGPDPRRVAYGRCGSTYNACHVARNHQRYGRFLWRHGRWFRWGTDRVRGHRGESWASYRQEARRVRAYARAVRVANRRRALVAHWAGVADCESGGNWSTNTGNGYYGGLQFNLGTWQAYGGTGMPDDRPAWYQATIADRVRTDSGLGHWPHCGAYYR